MKCNFYNDPGHGWLKVPIALLIKLGIDKDISPYSYLRGDYAYLEEDCDVTVFSKALRQRGKTLETKESHTDRQSKIRNYRPYDATYIEGWRQRMQVNLANNENERVSPATTTATPQPPSQQQSPRQAATPADLTDLTCQGGIFF